MHMFLDGIPITETFMYQTFKKNVLLSSFDQNTDAINNKRDIAERIEN